MSDDHENGKVAGQARWSIRIAAYCLGVLCLLLSLEALAWGLYLTRDGLREVIGGAMLDLDPYEMAVPEIPGHWRLRPGYGMSSEDLLAAKTEAGKWLGAEAIRETLTQSYPRRLVINEQGFKGPPIDPGQSCPRILALGDSVTFGMGAISYPYFMRQKFAAMGVAAEVINGGVEGYSPRNALLELPRYRELKPDIVTIYIGWNALFSNEMEYRFGGFRLKTPWLFDHVKRVVSRLIWGSAKSGSLAFFAPRRLDANDPNISRVSKIDLDFAADVNALVDGLREIGSHVFVVTLLGLYQSDVEPDAKSLEIGHLPVWTQNPYEFAAVAEKYNRYLEQLANKDGVDLIRLRAWGRAELKPLSEYFFDSVHFNTIGLKRVGEFLAQQLAPAIDELEYTCETKK